MLRLAGAALILGAVPIVVAATSVAPRTITAQSGPTRAVLVYFPYPDDFGKPHPRLRILRDGRRRFVEAVPPNPRDYFGLRGRVIPFALRGGVERKPLGVRDLEGDGRPEFSADGRIESISSTYYSADPIQIWSYRHGRFHDVTRRYPTRVAQDARRWWASTFPSRSTA